MKSILYFLACASFCFGGVLDHLKPVKNKGSNHTMRNIDFIYVINLDKRPEKWEMTRSQLKKYGIYPYRFSAVNGWELTLETINDVGVKFDPSSMEGGFMATSYLNKNFQPTHDIIKNPGQTYFCHCTARGTIGISLSHLSILKDAYDSGYETIWVMEDDIEIIRDPTIIPTLIDKLDRIVGKGKWDLLFTDRDIRDANGKYVPCSSSAKMPNFKHPYPQIFAIKKHISKHLREIKARFGATSIIYRRSGMKKILDFVEEHNLFLPYDMYNYLPLGISFYTVKRDVVTNLAKALSDNGIEGYLKNEKK